MILIIGAGLSGLLTAYRLKQEGIPFKILEARNRVGGRINTLYGKNNTPLEMGATWFGNQHTSLSALLKELEISFFEQYMDGTVYFQSNSSSPAEAIQIPSQPPSYRISGGTSNLVQTLYQKLDKKDILFNQTVKEIKFLKSSVQVFTDKLIEASTVVLAIPPKLWSKKILFHPQLPKDLMSVATQTHTWMEDSIKLALTYEEPFWEQNKLSGTLFSNVGPITEFYDHSNHSRSKYALCGFIDSSFKDLSYFERRAKVIDQVTNVFGEKAEKFIEYKECVWRLEENSFEEDITNIFPHQNNGNPIFGKPYFEDKLIISSSESSPEFPGYMEGAVHSANITASKIITSNINKRR